MIAAALIYCALMALFAPMVIRCRGNALSKRGVSPPEWAVIVAGPIVMTLAACFVLVLLALCSRETLGLEPRP